MNANESYKNIDTIIMEEIKNSIQSLPFHRYPDSESVSLRQAYTKIVNRQVEECIAGNGSDELLGLMIALHIKQGKTLYTLAPDFSMYDYYVSMNEGSILKYKCSIHDTFDVKAFIAQGKQNKVDLIIFSNPNNPTARKLSVVQIQSILEAFASIPVIVDEAYIDFCEGSMLDYIDAYSNLYVTRTLSKAYALAGIRCGFLLSNASNIAVINQYKVPYNVNSVTQSIASIALQHHALFMTRIEEIKQARDDFYHAYLQINPSWMTLYPSETNYIYGICSNKPLFFKALQKQGIQIRDYADDTFRITIGSKEENAMLLTIIAQLSKEK